LLRLVNGRLFEPEVNLLLRLVSDACACHKPKYNLKYRYVGTTANSRAGTHLGILSFFTDTNHSSSGHTSRLSRRITGEVLNADRKKPNLHHENEELKQN